MIPLNYNLRLLPDLSGLLFTQQVKKGTTILVGVIDSWLLKRNWITLRCGKKEYIWDTRNPLWCLSVNITMPWVTLMENSKSPIQEGLLMTQYFQKWRLDHPPAEVWVESKENTEWIVIGGSYKYQLLPDDWNEIVFAVNISPLIYYECLCVCACTHRITKTDSYLSYEVSKRRISIFKDFAFFSGERISAFPVAYRISVSC